MTATIDFTDLILVIADKPDSERGAVAAAWKTAGGSVERLARFWQPPAFPTESVRVYGSDTFALVVAEKFGLKLLSPPDDLLAHVSKKLLGRKVSIKTVVEALNGPFPRFIKPTVPKLFTARVFESPQDLEIESTGVEDDATVYVSEIVSFEAEVRCFLLDERVVTFSLYEGNRDTSKVESVASEIARSAPVPSSCVLDLGYIQDRGWVLVEANAAWGSGLNGCDAEQAIGCIERACRKRT